MLYKLCTNGRGVLMTRELCFIDKLLVLEFDSITDGYTAVIQNGDKVFYRPVREGRCDLDEGKLADGVIKIAVRKDDEVNPSWILDELYAATKDNCVAVTGNTLEYDRLLAEQRAEMDELRVQMREFKAELEQFRQDFDEVYAGTEII